MSEHIGNEKKSSWRCIRLQFEVVHAFNILLCERNQRCEVRSNLNNDNKSSIKDVLSKGASNCVMAQPAGSNDKFPNSDVNHLIKDTQVIIIIF